MLAGVQVNGLVHHVDELDLHLVACWELGQRRLEEEGNSVRRVELIESREEASHRCQSAVCFASQPS